MRASYYKYPKVTEWGRQRSVKTLLPERCALRKFHVVGGQTTRNKIMSTSAGY